MRYIELRPFFPSDFQQLSQSFSVMNGFPQLRDSLNDHHKNGCKIESSHVGTLTYEHTELYISQTLKCVPFFTIYMSVC